MNCPYCNKPAEWVANKEVYGKNYGKSYMIWLCKPCDAYVGCHNNTKEPLGTIANRELRQWRIMAKEKFIKSKLNGDWKNKKLRSKGYMWLNDLFGKEFHFGESTIEECFKVCNELKKSPHKLYEKSHGNKALYLKKMIEEGHVILKDEYIKDVI